MKPNSELITAAIPLVRKFYKKADIYALRLADTLQTHFEVGAVRLLHVVVEFLLQSVASTLRD